MAGQHLIFPNYEFRTRKHEGGLEIWDEWRKKWLVLTPEELVRQHLVKYLVEGKSFPAGRLAVEYSLKVNTLSKRADVVFFSKEGIPLVLIECKAPDVPITSSVFEQASRYNTTLQVPHLIVTNGLELYFASFNAQQKKWDFKNEIPSHIDLE